MKNFDWTQFTKRIAVKAPMQTIYNAWAVPDEIEKWFLETARYLHANGGDAMMNLTVEGGMTYAWRWYLYPTTEHGKVNVANGKDHFQFSFAGDCVVDVRLKEEHGHTIVELVQTNIPTDEDSMQNIRLGCSSGWSFYLVNLKSVYEGGLDLRSKDEKLKPMVNN